MWLHSLPKQNQGAVSPQQQQQTKGEGKGDRNKKHEISPPSWRVRLKSPHSRGPTSGTFLTEHILPKRTRKKRFCMETPNTPRDRKKQKTQKL